MARMYVKVCKSIQKRKSVCRSVYICPFLFLRDLLRPSGAWPKKCRHIVYTYMHICMYIINAFWLLCLCRKWNAVRSVGGKGRRGGVVLA